MRKVWIICGWVVIIAGIILVVAMGLALFGGAPVSKVITAFILGGFFVLAGWNFIIRGRQLPSARGSAADATDRVRVRQMVMQAIRIGSLIILAVAFLVGLLLFFSAYLK